MNKKIVLILTIIFLLGVACTACGTEKGEKNQNASGSSVSSSSVSESSVHGEDSDEIVKKLDIELEKEQDHFYANKTSYFMEIKDVGGNVIGFDQLVKNSGDRNAIRPDFFITLLGVTDEGVYYAKKVEDTQNSYAAALYRIPFKKGKSGKTKLDKGKEEVILEEPNGFVPDKAAYIDSHYIVYQPYMECVIKYDRKTKEKTELPTLSSTNSIVAAGEDVLIIADPANNDEFLYRLDLDSGEWEEIWVDDENLLEGVMTAHSGYLFCVRGDDVWAYDIKKKKREKLASRKQLLRACEQAVDVTGGEKPKEVYVEKLFCYNGKLYTQLQINWESGVDQRMGYAMFHMDFSEKKRQLEYDVSLSICMSSRSAESVHAVTPTIKWNSGRCHDIIEDGRVIMILNKNEATEQQLAYYNLHSKEFRLISKEDKEYFIPYMDTKEAFGKDDYELKESFMAVMPDDQYGQASPF